MIKFTLARCKTKAAWSAKLEKHAKLDLKAISGKFEVVLETPILLVVKVDNVELIVHSYGELLFKKCDDEQLMKKISGEVYGVGLRAPR